MRMSEPDVREMLRGRASQFSMARHAPGGVLLKARRRRSRTIVLASATLVGIASLASLSASLTRAPDGPGHRVAIRSASPSKSTGGLTLVTYVLQDTAQGSDHPHSETSQPLTIQDVRQHVECMRSRGFDLPDPVKTADGWAIIIDDPAASGFDPSSAEFREAAFVTCPLGGPLTGNLVLGVSQDKVDRFMSCMSAQGFDLPEPTMNAGGEYEFDLTQTNIDTSLPEWNRAVFVTCAPAEAG
jgi:hypothetical protein